MSGYAVLIRESSNRVYDGDGARLLAAELAAHRPHLRAALTTIERCGPDDPMDLHLTIEGDLDEHDRRLLGNTSGLRLLFRRHGDLLEPVALPVSAEHDSDLITIQRYRGKTNEQFTHLLVNLTVLAASPADDRRLHLLDPVAGRGTTLNRGLVLGFDVAGVEKSGTEVDAYRTFLSNYWKDHRVKHKLHRERIRKGPYAGSQRFSIRLGTGQRIDVAQADTSAVGGVFPGRKFDVIVGDLPYGVQHGARHGEETDRSAARLLETALPEWRRVLRHGGAIGLAWNLRTLPRAEMITSLREHGFDVVDHPRSFEHVVDRSITRDLVVATR